MNTTKQERVTVRVVCEEGGEYVAPSALKPAGKPSEYVIRKSENRNNFGLRGYWVYIPATRELVEFASYEELAIHQKVPYYVTAELRESRGFILPQHVEAFKKSVGLTGVLE